MSRCVLTAAARVTGFLQFLMRLTSHQRVVRLPHTDGPLPRGDITMAEAHILRIDSLPVVDRGNGIQTTPLVTKEIGSKQITTGLTRFPAGTKVPLHSHNCDEQVTILEGEAEAEVDGERHRLRPFDTTLVP